MIVSDCEFGKIEGLVMIDAMDIRPFKHQILPNRVKRHIHYLPLANIIISGLYEKDVLREF